MKMEYCSNCKMRTGHQRRLGVGTIIMILLTWGFWLLAIPCYPSRCIKCGND